MKIKKVKKPVREEDMSEKIGILNNDFAYIIHLFKNYKHLYSNKEVVDVLKKNAPNFFGTVQQLLIEKIVLSIGKLVDPSTSSLSLHSFTLPAEILEKFQGIHDLYEKAEFKYWRVKSIAHKAKVDLPKKVNFIKSTEELLIKICNFFHLVQHHPEHDCNIETTHMLDDKLELEINGILKGFEKQ